MSFSKKKAFTYLAYALVFCCLTSVCRRITDGFSIARITSEFPPDISWDPSPVAGVDSNEWNSALNQSYRYLGSGGQCFAFLSQDNRYVIKFFKTRFIQFGSLFFQTLPFIPQQIRQ